MPSDKRARQRERREQKLAVQQRRARRNRGLRRLGAVTVVVGVIVALVVVLSNHPHAKPAADKSATTTKTMKTTKTTKTTTTTAPPKVAPTCPPATAAGAAKREIAFTHAPPMCVPATGVYDATVKTDVGTFVIRMEVAASPAAVNNFVFLARYHFYDGVTFHRVIPDFVVQGGDPTGTGSGGPGYEFTGNAPPSSCTAKKDCYAVGDVAMANSSSSPSTDGSQFFVVVGAEGTALPADYTLFGRVISGMPVVQKIAADGDAADDGTPPKVLHHMISVTIQTVAA